MVTARPTSRKKGSKRRRRSTGWSAFAAAMNYVNHFIRERFPPPVVTTTRFMTTSMVS